MNDRQLVEAVIDAIESVSLSDLHKYPKLELVLPKLYESLIIEEQCTHHYTEGVCICGEIYHDK